MQFTDHTPRSFFNLLSGFRKIQLEKEKGKWHRLRWQTTLLLNIHLPKGKELKEKELRKFPWEREEKKAASSDDIKARIERMKKWDETPLKVNNKN